MFILNNIYFGGHIFISSSFSSALSSHCYPVKQERKALSGNITVHVGSTSTLHFSSVKRSIC